MSTIKPATGTVKGVPDRIWMDANTPFETLDSWHVKINDDDIEYVRADLLPPDFEQLAALREGLELAIDWMESKRGGPSEGLLACQVLTRLRNALGLQGDARIDHHA